MVLEQKVREEELKNQVLSREMEAVKSLQKQRERISADLHDDIGAGLSAIKLQAQFLESKASNSLEINSLRNLSKDANELTSSMREIVWSLNTQYDLLESLIQYIKKFAIDFFAPTSIIVDINEHIDDFSISIGSLVRRNILLSVKEILHNIIKHSEADKVEILLTSKFDVLSISIADNGVGFKENNNSFGNGLINMKRRIKEINGTINIASTLAGTKVSLEVPLSSETNR